jgi:hypothetical protein
MILCMGTNRTGNGPRPKEITRGQALSGTTKMRQLLQGCPVELVQVTFAKSVNLSIACIVSAGLPSLRLTRLTKNFDRYFNIEGCLAGFWQIQVW